MNILATEVTVGQVIKADYVYPVWAQVLEVKADAENTTVTLIRTTQYAGTQWIACKEGETVEVI